MGVPATPTERPAASAAGSAEPHLFLALDGNYPAQATSRHRLGDVVEVLFGRGRDRQIEREPAAGGTRLVLRFPDPWMSSTHAWIRRAGPDWVLVDEGSKNGSFINGAPQGNAPLVDGDVVQCGHTFFIFRIAAPVEPAQAADHVADLAKPPALSTLLVPLGRAFADALAGPPGSPVLLTGEHGTGKEHLARALHDLLGRGGPLIEAPARDLDPEALYRSGRDSGFGDLFASARGATLFLAEVCSLSMPAQYALVRALDHDAGAAPADRALVIAATHRDLTHLARRRAFRADLAKALSARSIVLPPLRQRREDIGLLIAGGLRNAEADARALSFSSEAARALLAYSWPHNVAELASCLHEAAERTDTAVVDLEHLPAELQRASFDVDTAGDTLDTIDLSDRARRQRELAAMLHAAGRVMILDKTRDD